MLVDKGLRVAASRHATDRAVTRKGSLSRGKAITWVERTALDALAEGRRAKRLPRWCMAGDFRARLTNEGVYRYVWDVEKTAVLLVHKTRDVEDEEPLWLVLTVMVPREEVAEVVEVAE